jgi:hypothetical protein
VAIGSGLAAVLLFNLFHGGVFVLRQHREPFAEHYRHGRWLPYMRMADAIAEQVPTRQRVVGPEARVLTFLSERPVFGPGEWRESEAVSSHQIRIGYAVIDREGDLPIDVSLKHVNGWLSRHVPTTKTSARHWTLVRLTSSDDVSTVRITPVSAAPAGP